MPRLDENLVAHPFPYTSMPLERRKNVLPSRNACSLAPAEDVSDAISTGNGFQRIDILGNPYHEELTFSQEALYTPLWEKTPEPPDLTGVMPEVRSLLRADRFDEASELVHKAQMDAGFGPLMGKWNDNLVPPGSLRLNRAFWLEIRQPEAGATTNYLRWLDLLTGKVTVQWENHAGAFSRELFATRKDDVVVQRLLAPKGMLDAELSIVIPGERTGFFNGISHPERCRHELEITEDLITLKWAYCPEFGQKGYVSAIRFIRSGGITERTERGIHITGAGQPADPVQNRQIRKRFHFRLRGSRRIGAGDPRCGLRSAARGEPDVCGRAHGAFPASSGARRTIMRFQPRSCSNAAMTTSNSTAC